MSAAASQVSVEWGSSHHVQRAVPQKGKEREMISDRLGSRGGAGQLGPNTWTVSSIGRGPGPGLCSPFASRELSPADAWICTQGDLLWIQNPPGHKIRIHLHCSRKLYLGKFALETKENQYRGPSPSGTHAEMPVQLASWNLCMKGHQIPKAAHADALMVLVLDTEVRGHCDWVPKGSRGPNPDFLQASAVPVSPWHPWLCRYSISAPFSTAFLL